MNNQLIKVLSSQNLYFTLISEQRAVNSILLLMFDNTFMQVELLTWLKTKQKTQKILIIMIEKSHKHHLKQKRKQLTLTASTLALYTQQVHYVKMMTFQHHPTPCSYCSWRIFYPTLHLTNQDLNLREEDTFVFSIASLLLHNFKYIK